MPRLATPLSDKKCRSAKPSTKRTYLCDGQGLFLLISPSGAKLWRLKYKIDGKPGMFALGVYPKVSLEDARELRRTYLLSIKTGITPLAANKQAETDKAFKAQNSFRLVAERYFGNLELASSSRELFVHLLEKNVFPIIGDKPIQDIKRDDISELLQTIVERGAVSIAHSTGKLIVRVFQYAVDDLQIIDRNPARRIRKTIPVHTVKHFPALLDEAELGRLLRCIDQYHGTPVVKAALQLAPLLACRPSELRKMEWAGVNLDAAEWRYEVSKVKRLMVTPLCTQVVTILRELHAVTGGGRWVFASPNDGGIQPISPHAILYAIRALGFTQDALVAHGFRCTLRTLGEEVLGFRADLLELHLSHKIKNALGRAYSRVEFLPERREMLQRWGDYLDELKAGGNTERKAASA